MRAITPNVYLIPTPIGNYDDITIRSLNLLKELEVLFCEDTRETALLLSHYGIKKKLISSHEHNEEKNGNRLLAYLEQGISVGIVSDQGTPVISDPGFYLTKVAIKNEYNVVGLPGATAFVPALITSGLPPLPFLFYGFLNSKETKRKKELEHLRYQSATLIFYEAPHRIQKMLENVLEIFGDRPAAISREISKKYEEILRGTISELIGQVVDIKGELVIIIGGRNEGQAENDLSLKESVNQLLEAGYDLKEAMKEVAKMRNVSKSDVYRDYHKD